MIERLAALARRFDRHPENLFDPFLADELAERARAQRKIEYALLFGTAAAACGRSRAGLGSDRRSLACPLSFFTDQDRQRLADNHFEIGGHSALPSAAVTESTARLASLGL